LKKAIGKWGGKWVDVKNNRGEWRSKSNIVGALRRDKMGFCQVAVRLENMSKIKIMFGFCEIFIENVKN
jgi:hypothetical protein